MQAAGDEAAERDDGEEMVEPQQSDKQVAERVSIRQCKALYLLAPPEKEEQVGDEKGVELLRGSATCGAAPQLPTAAVPAENAASGRAETHAAVGA